MTSTIPGDHLARLQAELARTSARLYELERRLGVKQTGLRKPAIPTPAGAVVAETAFGQAPSLGASTKEFARGDHSHGTPTHPNLAAHDALGLATQAELDDHTHASTAVVCDIGRTGVQPVANGVDEVVGFDITESTSTHDLRVGAEIVIATTGWYLVWSVLKWATTNSAGGVGGYRSHHLLINGALRHDSHDYAPEGAASAGMTTSFCRAFYLAAGDSLRIEARQQHIALPGTLDLIGGNSLSPILGVSLQS